MESDKGLDQAGIGAPRRPVEALWTRPLWMGLGAVSGLVSLCILLFAGPPLLGAEASAAVRLAAQVQFMHGMATFACATFMNIGARAARFAPAFFLGGIVLFCLPTYAAPTGVPPALWLAKALGLGAFATGWTILAWSARDIDRE